MGSSPPAFTNPDMARLPRGCGCVLPGTVALTAPSLLMLMLVALGGMVMPLATGRPPEVTRRPWASTLKEPSRV